MSKGLYNIVLFFLEIKYYLDSAREKAVETEKYEAYNRLDAK